MPGITDLATRIDRMVLYQVYPQSFADGNGDGIGDLPGITARLGYLSWLGVDALWLNPCFASPFQDAGYDISDFGRIAPRYGTNEDLDTLVEEAARRGIGIVLDLVAGHTSDQHPWFVASANDPDDERYIWADVQGDGFQRGPGSREQYYLPNFFPCQPALNFGYARLDPAEPWRQPVDAPGPRENIQALKDIMGSWFDRGVAGFRVDMAGAMVKDDPDQVATAALWRQMRTWLDDAYPGRLLLSEWGEPRLAIRAGFHGDFFLHFGGGNEGLALRSLWGNNQGVTNPVWGDDLCWADERGCGDAAPFVEAWSDAMEAVAAAPDSQAEVSKLARDGHTRVMAAPGLPTSNHDFQRLVCGSRTPDQVRSALVMALTFPVMPSVYYGDEIGMRFLPGVPAIEGASLGKEHNRAGSRTPMQWGAIDDAWTRFTGTPMVGAGALDSRYLPQDDAPDAPTAAAALEDPDSLLHHVRSLIALRHADRRLDVGSQVQVVRTTYPLAFVRGESLLVVANPSGRTVELPLAEVFGERDREPLDLPSVPKTVLGRGCVVANGVVRVDPFGYGVLDFA